MGKSPSLKIFPSPPARTPPRLSSAVIRSRPRDYVEWRTLRRWRKLPYWEIEPAGFLLRLAREQAGLTQKELARRLQCSQQAIAQAERWNSNPSVDFMRRWAAKCGQRLDLRIA
jgi:DNA-binding XRE family transcriptional regulator